MYKEQKKNLRLVLDEKVTAHSEAKLNWQVNARWERQAARSWLEQVPLNFRDEIHYLHRSALTSNWLLEEKKILQINVLHDYVDISLFKNNLPLTFVLNKRLIFS